MRHASAHWQAGQRREHLAPVWCALHMPGAACGHTFSCWPMSSCRQVEHAIFVLFQSVCTMCLRAQKMREKCVATLALLFLLISYYRPFAARRVHDHGRGGHICLWVRPGWPGSTQRGKAAVPGCLASTLHAHGGHAGDMPGLSFPEKALRKCIIFTRIFICSVAGPHTGLHAPSFL